MFFVVASRFCVIFSIFGVTVNAEADQVGDLFNHYVSKLYSGKVTLKISEQPDATGFFKEVYLEAHDAVYRKANDTGVDIFQVDSAYISVNALQLNPPSDWENNSFWSNEPNVKLNSFQSASLNVNLSENNINKALENKTFHFEADGKEFSLRNVSVSITTDGIKIKGSLQEVNPNSLTSYAAAWLLGAAANDYPVEVNTKLKIVDGKEIWLDNPKVTKGKFSQLDSYIERNITNRKEPILNLANYDLSKTPVTLGNIELKTGALSISTNTLPKALEGGIEYTTPQESSNLPIGVIEPMIPEPEVLEKIAQDLSIDASEIHYLTDANISAPNEPTQAMRDYVHSDNHEITGKLSVISVDTEGWYVFKVTLTDELYEQVKGMNISDLSVYLLGDTETAKVSSSSLLHVVYGLVNTWELNGGKLEKPLQTFIMTAFLSPGTPLSVYLAKMLLILLGGCNSGIIPVGLGVLFLVHWYKSNHR